MKRKAPAGRNPEELLGELRLLVGDLDPIPTEVTSFAHAALGWRRIDAELAELLSDSALETGSLALTRSGVERARAVTFRASDLEIDLEIHDRQPGVTLLGQLAPPIAAEIEVQRDDSSLTANVRADELGRFRAELAEGGRIRLRVRREGTTAPVETSWIRA